MEEKSITQEKPGIIKLLFGLNQEAPGLFLPALSVVYLALFFVLWVTTFPSVIPRPNSIATAFMVQITEKGLLYELGSTLRLVFVGMGLSLIVSAIISIGGKMFNFMRPISEVMKYFRFWSTIGFTPVIHVLTNGGAKFQIALLMFGVVPFLVTAFNTALHDIHKDPLFNYARTLGYSELRCSYYVIVRSRLAKLYVEIRNVFAVVWVMITTVEIANRDYGGIGARIFDVTRSTTAGEDPYAPGFALNLVVLFCGIIIDFLFLRLVLTLKEERAKRKKFSFKNLFGKGGRK